MRLLVSVTEAEGEWLIVPVVECDCDVEALFVGVEDTVPVRLMLGRLTVTSKLSELETDGDFDFDNENDLDCVSLFVILCETVSELLGEGMAVLVRGLPV